MQVLKSYVGDEWVSGTGSMSQLLNPATEEVLAECSSQGVDVAGALAYAREQGGQTLRAMTFAERGAVLAAMSKAIHGAREELIGLASANGGNTRKDAKFDIDGAWQTLAYYGGLGEKLGEGRYLVDGEDEQLGRNPRWAGRHLWTPIAGAAIHINAYNFPAWGFAEKAAVALLAGVPVVTKPATSTALVAARITELMVAEGILPKGAFSFLAGGARDLIDHATSQDCVAFTGGSDTAAYLRGNEHVVSGNIRLNVEADSLNSAVVGADVEPGTDTYDEFVNNVFIDMTQKTGQKCTASRRLFVPESLVEAVVEDLKERLGALVVGNPALEEVRMGPLVSASQLASVREGVSRLEESNERIFGDAAVKERTGVPEGKGFFIDPILFLAESVDGAGAAHEMEVFGPVTTVIPYSGEAADVVEGMRRGQGSLVASVYSNDRRFVETVVMETAAYHGRLFLANDKVAGMMAGPGTVMPMLVHGGPGRAGGGEELGGLRGLHHYMQRTALQGYRPILEKVFTGK